GLACFQILQRERARRARLYRYHDPRYRGARRRLRRGQAPFQRQGNRGIDRTHRDLQYERARASGASTRPRAARALSFRSFSPCRLTAFWWSKTTGFCASSASCSTPARPPSAPPPTLISSPTTSPISMAIAGACAPASGGFSRARCGSSRRKTSCGRPCPAVPPRGANRWAWGRGGLPPGASRPAGGKSGSSPGTIDTAACAAKGIKVLTIRRRANIACAELAIALMLTLAKKLHRLVGRIGVDELREAGYAYKPFDRRHTPNSNWPRIS